MVRNEDPRVTAEKTDVSSRHHSGAIKLSSEIRRTFLIILFKNKYDDQIPHKDVLYIAHDQLVK